QVRINLEQTSEPNPRGGPPVRAGHLYVTPPVMENLDVLGPYIADYVEIARLGDAFVVLINRADDEHRWRFLASKGVSRDLFELVRADLELAIDEPGLQITFREMEEDILGKFIHQGSDEPKEDVTASAEEEEVE